MRSSGGSVPAGLPESAIKALDSVVEVAGARGALVADRAGALRASSPGARDLDTTVLASLSVLNATSHRALASLVGEAEFRSFVYLGRRSSVLVADLGDSGVLTLLFEGEPDARAFGPEAKGAVSDLGRALAQVGGPGATEDWQGRITLEWIADAVEQIDGVFPEGA